MSEVTPLAPAAREAVELGARACGLALDEPALLRVAAQWQRLQEVIGVLDALPLALHDEPAPVFDPGTRP